MQREHHLTAVLLGDALGLLDGFLCFLSQSVESKHRFLLLDAGPTVQASSRVCPALPEKTIGQVARHSRPPALKTCRTLRGYCFTSTLTWRGFAASFLESVTVSTPLP